jgi:PilZ domain
MSLLFKTSNNTGSLNQSREGGGVAVADEPSISIGGNGAGARPAGIPVVAKRISVPASKGRKESRSQRRAGVKLAARVRPVDPSIGNFCDVLFTINASRQGLYLVTTSEHYHRGMRLRVTFPYDSAHDSGTTSEENAEVTRIERIGEGRFGVAVQLQSKARGTSGAERRLASRRPISAAAVVVDSDASLRIEARCSDLSMRGCYVDTLNPFPVGTDAHIALQMAGAVVATRARVNCSHVGMGMGLSFHGLTAEQKSLLSKWLTSDRIERHWAGSSLEMVKQAESLDRTGAIELIQFLLSKGILSKTDLGNLVSSPIII